MLNSKGRSPVYTPKPKRALGNEHDVIQTPATVKLDSKSSPPLVITEHRLKLAVYLPCKGGEIRITRKIEDNFPAFVCKQVNATSHLPGVCDEKQDGHSIPFTAGQNSYFSDPHPMPYCWNPDSNQGLVRFTKILTSEIAYIKPDGATLGTFRDHIDFTLDSEFV